MREADAALQSLHLAFRTESIICRPAFQASSPKTLRAGPWVGFSFCSPPDSQSRTQIQAEGVLLSPTDSGGIETDFAERMKLIQRCTGDSVTPR